ncbi:MAG: T9SS type A sorting domain-containing protein [Flavobacteriales bacterium]|nr:T9SS type A sorting domain-containing protein [Flavobacteriales bacterium]
MKTRHYFTAVILAGASCSGSSIATAQTVSAGGDHSLLICPSDSSVYAWGRNSAGQLGDGTTTDSDIPVQVNALTGVTAISAGQGGSLGHSLALRKDSTVWAWGFNYYGELGDGTDVDSDVPVQVSALSRIIAIATAQYSSIALKDDGSVWTWGDNTYGELGDGTNDPSNVPIQISSLTDIISIASGKNHCLALKDDGTVWAWGRNNSGQLGNASNSASNVPVQVGTLTNVTVIAGGDNHTMVLQDGGTAWACGGNFKGQLGNGTYSDSNVPVAVNITSITAIEAGFWHTIVLKGDGTVWAVGENSNGELGNGGNTQTNVFTQVSSLTDVNSISGGSNHTFAVKGDNTVWVWGDNTNGEFGNGTLTDSNVPLEVTGFCSHVTAVQQTADAVSVAVYPNPSNGHVRLNFAGEATNGAFISIYSTTGLCVHTSGIVTAQTPIDISGLSKGLYVATIYDGSTFHSQRIVLQ